MTSQDYVINIHDLTSQDYVINIHDPWKC